jgi:hypothetical protein
VSALKTLTTTRNLSGGQLSYHFGLLFGPDLQFGLDWRLGWIGDWTGLVILLLGWLRERSG